jgi:hypothetical protein
MGFTNSQKKKIREKLAGVSEKVQFTRNGRIVASKKFPYVGRNPAEFQNAISDAMGKDYTAFIECDIKKLGNSESPLWNIYITFTWNPPDFVDIWLKFFDNYIK